MIQDLRLACRSLLRRPGYAAACGVSLGLGTGVAFAVLLLVDAILLRPLPLTAPDRVVWVHHHVTYNYGGQGTADTFLYSEFRRVREQAGEVFAAVAGSGTTSVTVATPSGLQAINAAFVTAQYFDVLGIHPVHGRAFSPFEYTVAAEPVAIVTHAFWQARLGSDEQALGRAITVGGREVTVVGVLPRRFRGLQVDLPVGIFMPLRAVPLVAPPGNYLSDAPVEGFSPQSWIAILARLADGVTVDAAEPVVTTILGRDRPGEEIAGVFTLVTAAQAALSPRARAAAVPFVGMLMLAAGLMLLAACANAAGGMLIRNEQRRGEIAVRRALGVPLWGVLRLVLLEALLVTSLGVLVGLQAALWIVQTTAGVLVLPGGVSVAELGLAWTGWSAVGVGVLAILLTTVLCGCVPALQAGRALSGVRNIAYGRWRGMVVSGQVALVVVLLLGASLFGRSLRAMLDTDIGFDGARLFFVKVWFDGTRYEADPAHFYESIVTRLKNVAGMEALTFGDLPLVGFTGGVPEVRYRDGTWRPPELIWVFHCGPEYLQTLGVTLVAGRDFEERDLGEAAGVAIVNEGLARRLWGGDEPIGQWFTFRPLSRAVQVVGVVRDGRYRGLDDTEGFAVFLPWDASFAGRRGEIIGRGPKSMVGVVQREVRRAAPELPIYGAGTFEDHLGAVMRPQQIGAVLLGGFGGVALVLAVFGVYSAVAHSVACRTREIGIRMALGGGRSSVVRIMVRDALGRVGVGGAVGMSVWAAFGGVVEPYLFGVGAYDVSAYVTTGVVVTTAACLSGLLPAVRATRSAAVSELLRDDTYVTE